MATRLELKTIVKARLKSVKLLMDGGDWDGAAYMLGYVLECSLKACACKSLRLISYPENRKTDGHFMTHNFDQLLVLSGMSDVFSFNADHEVFQNWSNFTKDFPGDWPAMRYNSQHQQKFDKIKVTKLHENICCGRKGIISVIIKKQRW